jgi:hypothetical protein
MNNILTINLRTSDSQSKSKSFGLKLLHVKSNEIIVGCSDGSVKVFES